MAMENDHPTIKAIVYFKNKHSISYATEKQFKYLNDKGIATPILPIIRKIKQVKVLEANGSTTNWLEEPTKAIEKYEHSNGNSFEQNLQKNLAIQNKTFPRFLPLELSFNCTNHSKINLVIEKFPVQITFASDNDFDKEQQKYLSHFFKSPLCGLEKEAKDKLLCSQILNITFKDIMLPQNAIVLPNAIKVYHHGINGCANNEAYIQSMVNNKTKNQNIALFLKNREMGI